MTQRIKVRFKDSEEPRLIPWVEGIEQPHQLIREGGGPTISTVSHWQSIRRQPPPE